MEQLTQILQEATATIAGEYFRLPIHGADPVYRERVYCYELYHQMRLRWPQEGPFRLNGEVDKRLHPYFEDGTAPKPDLLLHETGTGNNCAVIEVKSSRAADAGIRKDLQTLTRFRNNLGYRRAIYLIYGTEAANTVALVDKFASEMTDIAAIELWLHVEAGSPGFMMKRFERF